MDMDPSKFNMNAGGAIGASLAAAITIGFVAWTIEYIDAGIGGTMIVGGIIGGAVAGTLIWARCFPPKTTKTKDKTQG